MIYISVIDGGFHNMDQIGNNVVQKEHGKWKTHGRLSRKLHYKYRIDRLKFFMAPPLPTTRTLRPRNVDISYKNTCGDPAPKATLKMVAGPISQTLAKPKIPLQSVQRGGILAFTTKGPKLAPGAVSKLYILIHYANIWI